MSLTFPDLGYPKTFAVAPMMAWTTRHCRLFHRQISKRAVLYTEMVTTGAIIHGDHRRFLSYHGDEHPVVLQIGGGCPDDIEKAVSIASTYHYDEINLNVGCPSNRVQQGKMGAVLMQEPNLVAQCYRAMHRSSDGKMTVKCRLSVDELPENSIFHFVDTVAHAGCQTFIVHARKAFLKGLDPKANRDMPPLNYELVYQLKARFPELQIIINGGIKTLDEIRQHYHYVDGVMIGRQAYHHPWMLAGVDTLLGGSTAVSSRRAIIEAMLPYIQAEIAKGSHIKHITRHWMGLFHGVRGTSAFKRYLNDHIPQRNDIAVIIEALDKLPNS